LSASKIALPHRLDMHWPRKVWHMAGVLMMFFAYLNTSREVSTICIVSGWSVFVILDIWRKFNPRVQKFVLWLMSPFMREYEHSSWAGTTYLLSGVLLIYFIFPQHIVAISLLFLAFADPIASAVGLKFGKDKIFGDKTLQGFTAAFVVCSLLTYGYLSYFYLHLEWIILISLLAGLLGAFAELIPFGKIDDNFVIPVMSSLGLSVLFFVFDRIPTGVLFFGP
jgi:diacylglycerol kinase (CTP)